LTLCKKNQRKGEKGHVILYKIYEYFPFKLFFLNNDRFNPCDDAILEIHV